MGTEGRKTERRGTRELGVKVGPNNKASKSGLRKPKEAVKENLVPSEGADRAVANFGQMFPSDVEEISRIETRTVTNTTTATVTLQQSVHIQTETVDTSAESSKEIQHMTNQKQVQRSPRRRRTAKTGSGAKKSVKPVAYYLPMETLSPVRLGSGRRVLREVGNNVNSLSSVNNLDSPSLIMSAGNREALAGYVAGLDVARPATAPLAKRPASPVVKMPRRVLSLQEALAERRKDFVRQSEARQGALAAAREARLLRREKQSAWLEEIARQSPRSRRMAAPTYTPVPVPRVFSHKAMVGATRQKYLQLPEVVTKKHEVRKSSRYKTNRLMAEIYSAQLQRKVVAGTVSLTHHAHII